MRLSHDRITDKGKRSTIRVVPEAMTGRQGKVVHRGKSLGAFSRARPSAESRSKPLSEHGNRTAEVDPLLRRLSSEYDTLVRLVRTLDARSFATTFAYEEVGNLVREIDARLNQTVHAYDALNRRKIAESRSEPLSDHGNRTAEVDLWLRRRSIEYDALDRMVRRLDAGSFAAISVEGARYWINERAMR